MSNQNSDNVPSPIQTSENTIPSSSQAVSPIGQKRIENWQEKKKNVTCEFSLAIDKDTKNEKQVNLKHIFKNKDLSMQSKYETVNSTLCTATGSSSDEYGRLLFSQLITACGQDMSKMEEYTNALLEALIAMQPVDEFEGMLISRLLMLHHHSNLFMTKAMGTDQSTQGIDLNINRSTKLMRLYNETFETLNKYRRRGEQKVTVTHNHVQVHDGGKAIVTSQLNHATGGGDHDKK